MSLPTHGITSQGGQQPTLRPKRHPYPKEECSVKELKSQSKKLTDKKCAKAKSIIERIKRDVKNDPFTKALRKATPGRVKAKGAANKHIATYEFNRTGKDTGVFLNWSDVHTKYQNFRLGACPRSTKEAQALFSTVLKDNVRVMVSLHEKDEIKDRCNDFWKNRRLKSMSIDGWKITGKKEKILGTETSKTGRTSKIIETTLVAKKGSKSKSFTHLHFDGWKDGSHVSSEKLFKKLLDRMQALSPSPKTPIAINCRAGVGRTGTTAVAFYLRRYIDAKFQEKKKPNHLHVNIPETIYHFRAQRFGIGGHARNFALLHSITGAYYKKCKASK